IRRTPVDTLFPYRRSSDLEQGFGLVADVDHLLRVPQLQAVEAGVGEARSAQVDVAADPAGVLGMIELVVIEDLGDELPEAPGVRSEEHTSELQSRFELVCR